MSSGNPPERAGVLIDLGRPDEAVRLLTQHLATEPDDWRALCELARAHLARNDCIAASRAAGAAIRAAPDNEWCHRLASIAELDDENYPKAVRHAQEAVRLDPENWQTHYSLSRAYIYGKNIELAHTHAVHAVHLGPLEARAHLQLSVAARTRGRRQESDAAMSRALELDPMCPYTLNEKAIREVERKKLGSAARTALAALRINPQSEVGKNTLSALMATLQLRLAGVTALGSIVITGFLIAERAVATPPYWPRATAGVVFIGFVLWVAWLTLRHVPPAIRRLAASRTLRWPRLMAPVLLVAAASFLITIAFMPADVAVGAATVFAAVLVVLLRLALLALVFMVVRGVFRAIGRGIRRPAGRRDGN